MRDFKQWVSFRFLGARFMALLERDASWHIYGDGMAFYGAWLSVDNFKAKYRTDGPAALRLTLGSGLTNDCVCEGEKK